MVVSGRKRTERGRDAATAAFTSAVLGLGHITAPGRWTQSTLQMDARFDPPTMGTPLAQALSSSRLSPEILLSSFRAQLLSLSLRPC